MANSPTAIMTMSLVIPKRSQPELPPPRVASVADWLAEPDDRGAELIDGYIVYKAFPSLDHARTQRKLGLWVDPFDHRPGDADRPGGWWIGPEVDMFIADQGVRPDMAGWRRDRFPNKPRPGPEGVITDRPDWIAEILSPSNGSRDLSDKLKIYHEAQVPHYWILDPVGRILLMHRRHPEGYILVGGAGADKTVRPEPFEALELRVKTLFDDE
jgi:Uma2 family endonuclease